MNSKKKIREFVLLEKSTPIKRLLYRTELTFHIAYLEYHMIQSMA